MKALGAGCFGQGVGCVFCPFLPQSKEKKSTTLKVETPFSVLKKNKQKTQQKTKTTHHQNKNPTQLYLSFFTFSMSCVSLSMFSVNSTFFSVMLQA